MNAETEADAAVFGDRRTSAACGDPVPVWAKWGFDWTLLAAVGVLVAVRVEGSRVLGMDDYWLAESLVGLLAFGLCLVIDYRRLAARLLIIQGTVIVASMLDHNPRGAVFSRWYPFWLAASELWAVVVVVVIARVYARAVPASRRTRVLSVGGALAALCASPMAMGMGMGGAPFMAVGLALVAFDVFRSARKRAVALASPLVVFSVTLVVRWSGSPVETDADELTVFVCGLAATVLLLCVFVAWRSSVAACFARERTGRCLLVGMSAWLACHVALVGAMVAFVERAGPLRLWLSLGFVPILMAAGVVLNFRWRTGGLG